LIALVGVIVPRRLRANWRQEWEAELRHREAMLAEWDRLDWGSKLDLLRRSTSAFWDALWLQPKRLEDEMIQDLRYGVRMLLKNPGFSLMAVITLALGIGANTTIFSVVNSVLLRPLQFRDPQSLVVAWATNRQKGFLENTVSPADFIEWRDQNRVFDKIAAFVATSYNLTGVDEPELLPSALVSANLFDLLGVAPALGRGFLLEEEKRGDRVVILSHSLWQRRYGSDPGVVGKSLTLNGAGVTVIGVMPPDFEFPPPGPGFSSNRPDLWVPLPVDALNSRTNYLTGIARLKPQITLAQAQAEMTTIASRLGQRHPETNTGWDVALVPLHQQVVGKIRRALLVLLGAVGCVLLIACANVANLLLARASSRRREIAIRTALGAGRARLVRQLLTESLLLSLTGGALGLSLAYWSVRLLASLNLTDVPRLNHARVDVWVLGLTLVVSLVTGLLFGLAPAAQLSKANCNESLKEASRGMTGGFKRRYARSLMVVSEVALALMLLVGAGLLAKSFFNLMRVNLGFKPDNVLTLSVSLPRGRYPDGQQQIAFFQQALQRITALPGVRAAGAALSIPLGRNTFGFNFSVAGQPEMLDTERPSATYYAVSPKYFDTMGIPLLKGRDFSEGDAQGAPGVVIVDEALAQRFFPAGDAIGKQLTIHFPQGFGEPTSQEIVGIVRNVKHSSLETESGPQIYEPYLQHPYSAMTFVVHSTTAPLGLASAIRSEIRALDKNLPIAGIKTMEELVGATNAPRQFNTLLLAVFSTVALSLAVVGLYGVLAYSVSERTQEMGVRLALGAQAGSVLKLVIGQGMKLVVIGVVIGLAGSFGLTRLMAKLLFGVGPTDPLTFISVAALLMLVALFACFIPARRATKVDPMVTLRHE